MIQTDPGKLAGRVLVWAAVLFTVGVTRASDPSFRVFVVETPLSNQVIRPDGPLPATCREHNRIEVLAARGEFEPASFVVETAAALRGVSVEVSDLQPGSGGSAIIPAAAVDVRVVAPVFRYTSDFPATINWVLVHDPNLIVVRDEPQPRSVLPDASPVDRAFTKTNVFTRIPVDTTSLQAGDIRSRRQFWLTIHVPSQAQAGRYRGTVTITSQNAAARQLQLELMVPSFDLIEPDFEYSVYHPAWLEGEMAVDNPQGYAVLTPDQYLSDLRNMAAHGCRNPNIYPQPVTNAAGNLDFSVLEKVLQLREQAGLPRRRLFLLGAGAINTSQSIDAAQYSRNVQQVQELVSYVRQRGYEDVCLMGADEATGEALFAQRDAWKSVREGGGRIFVAHYAGYTEGISDLLDVPIMLHPIHPLMDRHSLMPAERFLSIPPEVEEGLRPGLLQTPDFQARIRSIHQAGHRVMTYMDPCAGHVWVEHHRRLRGLGLWKAQLDGTMTWAYTHITQPRFRDPGPFSISIGFVLRGADASFDTLSWEAYREGYDDARYLAALRQELRLASLEQRSSDLAARTARWLEDVSADVDLNDWRRDMALRTEQLHQERLATESRRVVVVHGARFEFVELPAGRFRRGSPADTQKPKHIETGPVHEVQISRAFQLGRFEVTMEQWDALMERNPSGRRDHGRRLPVDSVSWEETQEFIRRLNAADETHDYRLPTEAEWEYACQAGREHDFLANLDELAWWEGNSGNVWKNPGVPGKETLEGPKSPLNAGSRRANEWGLHDLQGNVWEWVSDWYAPYPTDTAPVADPAGPPAGELKVFKGGSWLNWGFGRTELQPWYRDCRKPGFRHTDLGFRLARSPR